ncbi:MAG: hypothetical protein INR63_10975, partial [Actinomycetospora chiangmaiensis]|nr:hypothetical protein [Actinomycetospora chiangmaiensis]
IDLQEGGRSVPLREDFIAFDKRLGLPDYTYGWSKLTGEYLGRIAVAKYGLSVGVVRPFSGYGEDQDLVYPFPAIALRVAARERPVKEGPARRLLRRTAPPLATPAAAPEPAAEPPAAAQEASHAASQAASQAASPAGPPRRAVDPVILSDMARQLQEALSRPSSAVTPPPAGPSPAPPQPSTAQFPPPQPRPAVDPMAAAMATAPEPPAQPRPAPPATTPAAPAKPAPAEPAGEPAPKPVAKPVTQPGAQPASSKPAAAPNPFSVEEIEAEFARLLGRPLDKR